MPDNIQESVLLRGSSAAEARRNNRVLLAKEPAIELDTLKMKLGDGVTRYNDLPYLPYTVITSAMIARWNSGTGGGGAPSGAAGGDLTGFYPNPTLILVGIPGGYGSNSETLVIDVDSAGRVVSITPESINITQSQVVDLVTDLANKISLNPGASDGDFAMWGGGDLIDNGISYSIDGTLASNSDSLVVSEKAIKTYVDNFFAFQKTLRLIRIVG